MNCPFLNETHVRFCRHSIYRKMIVSEMDYLPDEKCSSTRYSECAVYREHEAGATPGAHCPFLEESLMQYCSAASLPKFVPYSDSVLTRCATGGYRYCDAYVALATAGRSAWAAGAPGGEEFAGPIHVPLWLHYAPNHMWVDVSDDGVCHVGIDAFLARIIGRADRVTLVATKDVCRPSAILTVRGIDYRLQFPRPVQVSELNVHLHAEPLRLTTDPYRLGWMFRGRPVDGTGPQGLRTGEEAVQWMRSEVDRMTQFTQSLSPDLPPILNDGGEFEENLMRRLSREQARELFNTFFSGEQPPA